MSATGLSWKDVFSLKAILASLILVCAGAGGFAYYYGQTPPVPAEQISFTPLPEKIIKGQITEDETTEDHTRRKTKTTAKKVTYSTVKSPATNEIILPTVNILSPTSGTTFVAPAAIKLEAEVLPKNRKIEKVEFFYSRISGESLSIYNTIKDVQIPNSPLIRIGEARQIPYTLENAELNVGIYSIYSIVTDGYGIRQISSPQTIMVNAYPFKKNELVKYPPVNNEKDIGWSPQIYRSSPILTSPKCLMLKDESSGENLIVKGNTQFTDEGQTVDFEVNAKSPNQFQKLKYEWRVTAGKIIEGQSSNSISVDTGGLGGQTLIATVRVEDEAGCSETVSGEAYVLQQGEPVYDGSSYRAGDDDIKARLEAYAATLFREPSYQAYIITYGGMPFCKGEAEKLADFTKNYLIYKGINKNRIVTINGGYAEVTATQLYAVPEGAPPPTPDRNVVTDKTNIKACSAERLNKLIGKSPRLFSPPKHPYKKCSDIDEKLNFLTTFDGGYEKVNICPFNDEDPQDARENLRMKLSSNSIGIFGNTLSHKYLTNGGVVKADGANAIWDLDFVKLIPGFYTTILEVDDGCESKNVTAKTARITNYCTPCLSTGTFSNSAEVEGRISFSTKLVANDEIPSSEKKLNYFWRISQGAIVSGQGTNTVDVDTEWILGSESLIDKSTIETSVEISGLKHHKGILSFNANLPFNKNALSYDWTVSDSKGVIISGQKTKNIEIDTSRLKNDGNIILYVRVSGFNILHFTVGTPEKWAIEKSLTEKDIKYKWSVDKGTIVSGQGTNHIEVDTGDLPYGTNITATVGVDGVREYCVDEVYEVGRVGFYYLLAPRPNEFDAGSGGEKVFRRALRKKQNGEIIQSEIEQTTGLTNQTAENGSSPAQNETPKSDEKEYVKILWSNEPVQIQQSFSIVVTYNRVKESLDITDTAGQVLAELKSKDLIQLVKDKWGDDHVVWAQIRLQSAGLYQSDTVTCAPNCQTDFLPLTAAEQTWTFNVTARNAGEHTFNLEMWVEGRHKKTNYKTSAERVWGRDNLKVTVREDTPTKNQLFYSSGFLCFMGLIFAVRGIKFNGVKILISGGNIVGRDMAGGDIVKGDKVGGNKTIGLEVGNDDSINDNSENT